MRFLRITLISLVTIYIGLVVLFESWLGYSQPKNSNSLIITTFHNSESKDRVLSAINNDSKLYISANHWPRAWYRQALDNPNVEVKMPRQEEFSTYTAVPLEGAEDDL